MNTTPEASSGPFVESTVRYLHRDWRTRNHIPNIFDSASRRANTEIVNVEIRDARPIHNTLELDRNGFNLYRMESEVSDFQDEKQIQSIYYAEVRKFLKQTVGADEVYVTQHLVRTEDKSDFNKAYARFVHCDYSMSVARSSSLELLKKQGMDPSKYEDFEFAWYNSWQPFDHVVEKNPLAVIDSSTLELNDIRDYVYGGYGKSAKSSIPVWNPHHRFYYFSQMQTNEIMLIKQLDSREISAKVSPHTSFDDPSSPEDAPPRRSVEVRLMCVFK